jgi:c-di-GMP phosphodiesterase
MQDHPVLGQVALGYSPMIDRQRAVIATRLTVFPERPDAAPDPAALLRAFDEVWPPAEGAASGEPLKLELRPLNPGAAAARPTGVRPPLSLNLAGEALLNAMMGINPGPNVLLEVPAFMAADAAHAAALQALHAAGTPLMLKGRPMQPLPPEVLACFSHSVVDVHDERRTGPGNAHSLRQITTVQDGVRSSADVKAAFEHGAVAVMGWQFDDPLPVATARGKVPPDIQVVMELVSAVDREEPVGKLEALLKRDPTLAFRLMRYLNSPAFGLSVEINSFGHALMLLGYGRLKRWLALLLASSTKDANAKPLLFAAVRRGLLLEELVRNQGDAEMRGEIFICGVFSLLDRLLNQPFSELLASVPVPERVRQALADDDGPFYPFMELVRAIESSAVFDIRECSERLLLGPAEVNRALLRALSGARQLD